jgi:chemotaxis protein CheD
MRKGIWMRSEDFCAPRVLHIVQGEVAVSMDPRITFMTVLGPCVAVCLFDPEAKLGGMAHFMFPNGEDYALDETRFCNQAIMSLIAQIQEQGGQLDRLQASLFGAAKSHDGGRDIGRRNANSALGFLKRQGLPIVKQGIRGDQVRRIRFSPTTGACGEQSMNDGSPHEALALCEGQ